MSRVPGAAAAALAAAVVLACAVLISGQTEPARPDRESPAVLAPPSTASISPAVILHRPRTARVSLGEPVTVAGRVSDEGTGDPLPGATVLLELRVANGWMPLPGHVTTTATGDFRLPVPTHFYGRKVIRARALPALGQLPAISAATAVTVRVPYRPQGRPADHRFLLRAEGHVVRYDPCRPLGYYVNLTGAPPGALRQVHLAMAKIRAATGLRLSYMGATSKTPLAQADGQIDEAIVVAWSTPRRVPELAGATVGVGGSAATWSAWQPTPRLFRGRVVLDATWDLLRYPSQERAALLQHVLMHEAAHAVGLHHVDAPGQVMHEGARPLTRFGAGDLAGLAKLGAAEGCISAAPTLKPVM